MRDDICTIPVSEVFEERDGCPICRMYATVEERILNYILGDAMMEPDVRIETNRLGFCPDHYRKMTERRGRLQLALMLETHIKEVQNDLFAKKFLNNPAKKAEKARKLGDNCFVCQKIDWGIDRMIDTVYRCYENESEFREMFNAQPMFCLPHYERLIRGIDRQHCPKHGGELSENLTRITGDYMTALSADISKYCTMYDYRNRKPDADWGDAKTAVERCIGFLNGEKV